MQSTEYGLVIALLPGDIVAVFSAYSVTILPINDSCAAPCFSNTKDNETWDEGDTDPVFEVTWSISSLTVLTKKRQGTVASRELLAGAPRDITC